MEFLREALGLLGRQGPGRAEDYAPGAYPDDGEGLNHQVADNLVELLPETVDDLRLYSLLSESSGLVSGALAVVGSGVEDEDTRPLQIFDTYCGVTPTSLAMSDCVYFPVAFSSRIRAARCAEIPLGLLM